MLAKANKVAKAICNILFNYFFTVEFFYIFFKNTDPMNISKIKFSIILFLSIFLFGSCSSVKNIAYLQNVGSANDFEQMKKDASNLYDARIKPKDLLSITVVTSDPLASVGYNLTVPQVSDMKSQNNLLSQPSLQAYLVDNEGNIDFPIVGKFNVGGLTRKELVDKLQAKISSAFSREKPIITVRIINYTVNILGEVQRPGKFESDNERMTIFDGLALAGDMTIYGIRENVKVVRENADGSKKFITVNLNDNNIIYSEAYYLEQNDVVYVEPNKSRSNSSRFGAAESFGISSLSVLLTLTSLVLTVVR